MNSALIGFGYQARRGKDTAASAIIDAYRDTPYNIRRYAFADELKREVNDAAVEAGGMFSLYLKITEKFPHLPMKFDFEADMTDPLCPLGKQRELLQWWGTEFRRAQDAFYWVRRLDARIKEENPQFAIITDMRFRNEYLYVKSRHGYTVKLDRIGYVGMEELAATHVSESELRGAAFDYEIAVQDGQLEELKRDAVEVFGIIVDSLRQDAAYFATGEEHANRVQEDVHAGAPA